MQPHERVLAARALLVGPTRLLSKLIEEVLTFTSLSAAMQSELLHERDAMRDAGNVALETMYLEADARIATLTDEMVRTESGTGFSLDELTKLLNSERADRKLTEARMEAEVGHARAEAEQLRSQVKRNQERCEELQSIVEALKAANTEATKQHQSEIARLGRVHAGAIGQLERERQQEVHRLHHQIKQLELGQEAALRDNAATKVNLSLRLQNLTKTKLRESREASVTAQRLRDEQQALELQMEREKAEASERIGKLHNQQTEGAQDGMA